jgi:hypothetical protein
VGGAKLAFWYNDVPFEILKPSIDPWNGKELSGRAIKLSPTVALSDPIVLLFETVFSMMPSKDMLRLFGSVPNLSTQK